MRRSVGNRTKYNHHIIVEDKYAHRPCLFQSFFTSLQSLIVNNYHRHHRTQPEHFWIGVDLVEVAIADDKPVLVVGLADNLVASFVAETVIKEK